MRPCLAAPPCPASHDTPYFQTNQFNLKRERIEISPETITLGWYAA
ncbi:hypothetical protein OKW45_000237 [Paraburkholderia sp. WSM4175]